MKYNNPRIEHEILKTLSSGYSIESTSCTFIPLGEDSYSYKINDTLGTAYFVKYSVYQEVVRRIDTINALLDELSYLPFIIPPVIHKGRSSANMFDGKLYVYPFIEGNVIQESNTLFDAELTGEITDIMAKIHATQPKTAIEQEQFTSHFSAEFNLLERDARNGLLSQDIQALLKKHTSTINNIIEKFEALGEKFRYQKPMVVLTHGDITGLNLIRTKTGLKLVDWDGACMAPLERDIMFLIDNPHFSYEDYRKLTKGSAYNPELKSYYSMHWALESIIGNFNNIPTGGSAKASYNDYVEEIEEYAGYYS